MCFEKSHNHFHCLIGAFWNPIGLKMVNGKNEQFSAHSLKKYLPHFRKKIRVAVWYYDRWYILIDYKQTVQQRINPLINIINGFVWYQCKFPREYINNVEQRI